MCSLEQFEIDLKSFTAEEIPLKWNLDDSFFALFEDAQLKSGSLHVSGSIRKAVGFFELHLSTVGTVEVTCDRCLEPMRQPIEADLDTTVKLGAEDSYDDDVVTIDETRPVLNTAWLIYELIALAVPIRHVHQPGDCNVAMSEKLEQLSAARSSDADAQDNIDPRWAALLKIKN
ncbi:MAG: DUF177 domain-containing protein [Prevotella sp.]|nr:DUF177 domain-containing protein [Prevotella sp.]